MTDRHFLTCGTCRSCCLLIGVAARAISHDPPSCPACGEVMVIRDQPIPVTLRQAS